MAICLNLKEPVLLLLLIVITSGLSGDLMQLLETLKEDAKNSDESNKFVRTVLEHKNDLEWIENLGQQYRGIRDTLQSDEDLVNCNWNPSNSDQYRRRIQERSNNHKYKFRQNNNRYSPYAFSPYSSFDDSARDKRQSLRYEYRPQIQVRNNGLTGALRPYNLKHVQYKRKSDNINDAEEQKVINIAHEKELEKLESKPREEYHDILGLRDYSQKEEIIEENKEYLKTSTEISESQHKNKRYGNNFDSNENILFPKWNRMLKKSTGHYNLNPDCDNGKCANVNNNKMEIRDIVIPERNIDNADHSIANKEIAQAVFDPECTSCSTDNNQFQIMVLPESVATHVHEINPTISPIVLPIIMKSPIPTKVDLNSEQDTHKIIEKKEVTANHSSLTQVPFVTNPPIDIIHSKNYHNFVPEKDIYIDTNKFNANTEENIFKDILETEKYVPEYGPLHIARIQPATPEPAHVFSFEYTSQKAIEDRAMLNEMTEEEKQKAAEEAHKLMEVDKEFNERNEPELDAKSDVDLPETKDDSKSNTPNSNVNFKSRSLKYIDMDKEEGQYLPYMDYDNNYRYVNRHTKRSNAKEVIQNGLKKLKKIFGFGNDKLEYEEVTDAYRFDEGQSNILNEDFNDYEYVPKHRDKTVHRKYHRKKEGNGDHKNVKVHKSPRLTHQYRKHLTDIRKRYKADECTETTPKTTTASCITTSTTPSTTTTTTTTPSTTTKTTTPSTTTTTQTTTISTTACITPSTTTSSSATCTNSVNPATTANKMEVIGEEEDDYLADENEQEACTEPTTEHIKFGPTANASCEGTPNKKNEEMQIKNNEDLIDVTGAGHSTIASASTENLAITTFTEVISPITTTEVSSITISESTTVSVTTTVSEAAPTTSSEATSTTGSEATSTIVSESAGTTVPEIIPTTVSETAETTASAVTTIAVSETTSTISEIATPIPETSTVSKEATTSLEHTTPNVLSTDHTNTSETTTHKTATTLSNGKHITEDKEHENNSKKPVVEDFPDDLTMDKKLHGKTTEVAHTTSHEGIHETTESEENATECTETGDNTKRKKSIHETAGAKRNIHHSDKFSKQYSKRSNNNKHLQRKDSNISHIRISKKHHKKNNKVINQHRKRDLVTVSKQNNDEDEDMDQEKLRTIPVLTKYNNNEDDDMTDNNGKIIQQSGKYEPKRTNNNFRYRTNKYGPNKFSLNRYIPRNKRHHFEHYNNNHPKIRIRRSNHMLPVNKYSSSQNKIISQETAQDDADDDLNYFIPAEFETKHFKNPFVPEQLNENINYKEIKNGVSEQKNTRHVGGRSMHLSKRNYDANFQQISAENMNRRNRMDVNNEGKNEHVTNARDTSHHDGSIDTHLKDQALKGQLAAQIVESIFNEVESSGQLKKHIGPGLDKGHTTKPVSNQGISDKHQNEEEEKQLENMQQNIMKSLNKLIDEEIQRKTCVPLEPESSVFLEQLTNKQNNLAKSYETELDVKATDKPPHQDTFLFEEPKKAKSNNNTHHDITAVPGVQTTPQVHTKQIAQNAHENEPQTGHGNHNARPIQNEIKKQHGLNQLTTHIELNAENGHTTENEQHTDLSTVEHNTEHISQPEHITHDVTTHTMILQSPISQDEHAAKTDSTTCSKDAEIDIFTPEHVSAFEIVSSESPPTVSTELGLSTEHELSAEHGLSTEHGHSTEHELSAEHGLSTEHELSAEHGLSTEHGHSTEHELSAEHGLSTEHELSTEHGLATEHELSTEHGLSAEHELSTEHGLSTEHELSTEHGLATEHELSTEHGLSAEHGLATEHELLTEHGLATEHELSTEHGLSAEHELSTEHGLSAEHELSTEHGISTESSKTNTDTKEMEEKKERVKQLMKMYNDLPGNDRHKFCSVYQYLHKQNIFLDRVIRQIKKSTRSARYSQEYFENRRHRYPFYEYPRNEYVPRYYQQYLKPRHQIWSQQYVSNDPQTPSDKYMKLVKRAMYYRRKREAEERLRKQIQMNTTGKIKKLEELPAVTTEGMEDLTFNYSNT